MEKIEAIKANRVSLHMADVKEVDEGLTSLSNIRNQNDGFQSSDPEALKFIESNVEFKKSFKDFIDGILKFDGPTKLSEKYLNLMQSENEKQNKNPSYMINTTAIEDAKQDFFNHPEVKALSENNGRFDLQTYELDIEKKFPKEMHELKRIMNSGSGEKRANSLKDIGKRLDMDGEKWNKFIDKEYQREVQDTGEIWEAIDEETAKKMRGEEKFEKPKPSGEKVNFKSSVEKGTRPLTELLSQLVLGDELDEDSRRNEIKELENEYKKVKEYLKQWESESEQTVRNWARQKRGQLQTEERFEALAVMDQGNHILTKGHRLRDPQIIAILIFMRSKENQGQLCQIQTGEGKTVIVSLLATMKVLQGKQIDVITSNQVLATEGVESRKDFYEFMGVSVDSNNADENYRTGPRECYKADVVYGSIGNFQFDYLRDSFEGFGTRAQRNFDTVLLDEVDSMLIDNGGYVAKLAGPFPGIESLKYVYLKIWQELIKVVKGQGEDAVLKLTEKAEQLNKDITLSENELQSKFESFQGKMLKSQTDEIKGKIKATNPAKFRLIPSHLHAYAEASVDTWINNAIYALFDCNENEKYVIKEKDGDNVIVPVDYQNTGVTLRNTIWSNGLHQFVQLKHNLQLTSETLTTCFISNVGYIKLYKNNMFGMTGTLGSINEQKMLSKAYSVGYAKIPTYKEKMFSEIPGIVVQSDNWHNTVTIESYVMARKKRSVLIICETIKELRDLEKNIESLKKIENFSELQIRIYPDEDSSKVTEEKVGESEIIIATNIAGRGTDFKTTKDLEAAGGLHVIVSFLPVNKRVEDQAFGRTARQGKSGTAQLIIKDSGVMELGMPITSATTFAEIKKRRDEIEKERLDNIENIELAEIDFQDEIFAVFSELYSEFKENNENPFLTKDLKEFWAFWLNKKHYKGKNVKALNVFDEFEGFKLEASVILGSGGGKGKISHNPYYSILEAESYLSVHNVNEAREALDNALALAEGNSEILCSVPLKRFEVAIDSGRQLTERFSKALKKVFLFDLFSDIEKDEAYKASAIVALEDARKAFEIEIDHMKKHIIEEGGDSKDFNRILIPVEKNLLLKHLYSRFLALQSYHMHVQSLQEQINTSGNTIGLALNSKIPDFFKSPKTDEERKIKEAITEKELNELSSVGVEYFYGLREVHDVPVEIVRSAQGQIIAGIALLGAGIVFPPALPAVAIGASTLISEGICDIVIELISKGSAGFDAASFIKGKVISYGISIVTLGISAISTAVRVLNHAVKACKAIASLLRSSPFFKKVCEKIAAKCDRFASLLSKTKDLKVFGKLSKAEQLEHLRKLELAGELEKLKNLGGITELSKLEALAKLGKLKEGMTRTQAFKEAFKLLGKETTEGIVSTVVTEKIVTESLERVLESLKPKIHAMVKKTVDEKASKENLKLMGPESIFNLTKEIIVGTFGEMTGEVFREIALGVLRHSKSWKLKVASLVADTGISLAEVFNYTENFCEKFNKHSGTRVNKSQEPASKEVVDESINLIAEQVTEKIYGMIINLMGKYASTFVVTPLIQKGFQGGDKKKLEENLTKDETDRMRKLNELVEAHETLGIKPGATEAEIAKARRKAMLENHPDRNRNDPNAHEKAQKINEAYELVMNALKARNDPNASNNIAPTVKLLTFSNKFPAVAKNNQEMANRGNIKTLSEAAKQHIVVNIQKLNGKNVTKEFGVAYKGNGNETVTLSYLEPQRHFEAVHVPIESQISSGPNNCFFDAYTTVLRNRGQNLSPEQARWLAEQPSFYNTMYNGLNSVSKILDNPLTKDLYDKMQTALLVGGASGQKKKKLEELGSDDEMGQVHKKIKPTVDEDVETIKNQINDLQIDADVSNIPASTLNQAKENYSFKGIVNDLINYPHHEVITPKDSIILSDGTSRIDILQNLATLGTLRVTYPMPKSKGIVKEKTEQFRWKTGKIDEFEKMKMDEKYSPINQKQHIAKALTPLGSTDLVDHNYIQAAIAFQRAHLAAKMDFLRIEDQQKTYNFLNAIPMWGPINQSGGSWAAVEMISRNKAVHSNLDIVIGTLGIMELEGKQIFFDPDNTRLPVPRWVYKIIKNKTTNETEVYVISNNPYETLANIQSEMAVFGGKAVEFMGNVEKGYCFTVPFDDFEANVIVDLTNTVRHTISLTYGEIEIHQDAKKLNSVLVKYEMQKRDDNLKEKTQKFVWPSGMLPDFEGMKVDELFGKTSQRQAIAFTLFGNANTPHGYITDDFVLQRGHLAAKMDFMKIEDQLKTFNFLNVVPMWNSINTSGGNWSKVEAWVRNRTKNINSRITVGTLGIMTLEGKEIFLDPVNRKIPVPRYIYKVVTTVSSGNSEVFVFYNNPHVSKENVKAEIDEVFENDKILELSGRFADITSGYTFKMPYKRFQEVMNKIYKKHPLPDL